MRKVAFFVPLLAGLVAVACGSSAEPAPAPEPAPQAAPVASTVNFDIMDFTHQNVTVSAGTTVVWTNRDSARHTTTSEEGVWDSGALQTGGTFSFTFPQAGTFKYRCDIHPSMTATVTVNPS